MDAGCVCRGNWRKLVEEYECQIGATYIEDYTDEVYVFYGLVWAEDDFYYGMRPLREEGRTRLLSCVGSIEGFGFRKLEE